MKKFILITLLTALGSATQLSAVGKSYTHLCGCAKESVPVDCEAECKKMKAVWSGDAMLSNVKDFKGITCFCADKQGRRVGERQVRCDGGRLQTTACGRSTGKWTQKIYTTHTGQDMPFELPDNTEFVEQIGIGVNKLVK